MKFKEFVSYLSSLEKISSRIEITKVLSSLFKKLEKNESRKAVYLLLGGLSPKYESVVFNIADKMILKAIATASGQEVKTVSEQYKKLGDLGDVAKFFSDKSKEKASDSKSDFKIEEVFEKLESIATDSGEGSQERKIESSAKLLTELGPESSKFVVRIMLGKLRLGFSDSTILDAISWMMSGDKSHKKELENAYFVTPDVGLLLQNVKKEGIKKATMNVKPVVGIPVLPVLAQRIKSPKEMIEKMGRVAVEPKLDGLRLSLHFDKNKKIVKAYTRNLNENSWMFPELANLGKYIKAKNVILDSEAVGLSEDSKKMASFQTTMTRRRKHHIKDVSQKTKITFYVFDILEKDGDNLMNKKFEERRKVLEETIDDSSLIKKVDSTKTDDPTIISKLQKKFVKDGFEGAMIKKQDSAYVPGRTGWRWVKMKQGASDIAKLADTVDVLVMGYSVGKGKRTNFGVGRFLVGVKNGDKFKTTTKIGTGLTDEQFKEMKKRLSRLQVGKKPEQYVLNKIYTPDFWVKPGLVVEIAADEITKSPTHSAGLALRFPRLIRFRGDKNPDQITTKKELEQLFGLQNS